MNRNGDFRSTRNVSFGCAVEIRNCLFFQSYLGSVVRTAFRLTPEKPWGHLWILLCLTPDDFTRQRGKCLGPDRRLIKNLKADSGL